MNYLKMFLIFDIKATIQANVIKEFCAWDVMGSVDPDTWDYMSVKYYCSHRTCDILSYNYQTHNMKNFTIFMSSAKVFCYDLSLKLDFSVKFIVIILIKSLTVSGLP